MKRIFTVVFLVFVAQYTSAQEEKSKLISLRKECIQMKESLL